VLRLGAGEDGGDPGGDRRTARDRQGTAFAEVILDIDDEQCACHGDPFRH
jgi:hypothetical protein